MRFSQRNPTIAPGKTQELWTIALVGAGNQSFFGGRSANAVFVGDGDGVLYANLRLRAYSLTDGRERASVRTGTTARCMTIFPDGDLLVATDHRLHRLDPSTLAERQRWERGVPEFSDSIALVGNTCALANWQGPSVSLVDLATGRTQRRSWVALPRLIESPNRTYLLASGDGGLSTIDVDGGDRTDAFRTTSGRDAVIQGDRLWIIDGRPRFGVRDMGESKTLRAYDVGRGVEARRLRIPAGANRLFVAGPRLWAVGRASIVEVDVGGEARVIAQWMAPVGHQWSAVDPILGLAFSSTVDFTSPVRMACHVLGRP